MKKLLNLTIAICLVSFSSLATAEYVLLNDLEKDFPEESYKTAKLTQVKYHIRFSNYFYEDNNTEVYIDRNKDGLYIEDMIELKNLPSKSFPDTTAMVVEGDLISILKINQREVVSKFKSIAKKDDYECRMSGLMNAQFEVHYDGRNYIRFPYSISAKIKSAVPIGKTVLTCKKL